MKQGMVCPWGTGEMGFADGVRRCGACPEQTWL
jgi:hypothetical protein